MRLLLDESVPVKLRRSLKAHLVRTAVEMGWSGVKNGTLLALAAGDFDAFITVDKNMQYQQDLNALPIALVVLDARSNDLASSLPLTPALDSALGDLARNSFVRIGPTV